MNRQISVNLELSNKERKDGRRLIMIRLSENRKHIRFSIGISVYQENFKGKNRFDIYLTESEHQYSIKNESLKYYLAKTKAKLNHFLLLNPLLKLSDLKTLLVGELVGRSLMPDIVSIMNAAYKKNDSLTYTTCNFLISYIGKLFVGIDFRYENLMTDNVPILEKFMLSEGVHKKYIDESIAILNRMRFKIKVL